MQIKFKFESKIKKTKEIPEIHALTDWIKFNVPSSTLGLYQEAPRMIMDNVMTLSWSHLSDHPEDDDDDIKITEAFVTRGPS